LTISVLDSGALIALERNDRDMWSLVKTQHAKPADLLVPAAVLVEVSRDRSTQVLLNMALKCCRVVPLDEEIALFVGALLAISTAGGAVDATVVATAATATRLDDVEIYTSDLCDMRALRTAAEQVPELVEHDIVISAT